jgi:Zn-dependent protease with chaperone function
MNREQFDALIRKVEGSVAGRPHALKFRVAALAVAGYAGLLLGFFLSALGAALFLVPAILGPGKGAVALYVVGSTILGIGGWASLRPLWVRFNLPTGRAVSRKEAPALFECLDGIRKELRSQPFHSVLIVPDCNAAVIQWPRLGVFGWHKNILLIGQPLLEGMDPEELRAVLAHEFAHLSRQHNRFSGWIYRLRRSWQTVFEELSKPRARGEVSLRPVIALFIRWFWPRFHAHAFVLSRANEFEADGTSARLAGAEAAGKALVRVQILGRYVMERFWADVWLEANREEKPPTGVFERMAVSIRTGINAGEAAKWLEQAFRATTGNDDTHPCLRERLGALGVLPGGIEGHRLADPPPCPVFTAGDRFVGELLTTLRADLASEWGRQNERTWRERNTRAAAIQRRLESMAATVPEPAQDVDCLWEKARLLIDLEGDRSAAPVLGRILELRPEHAPALYCLGRKLLADGDPAGVDYLERAMDEDEEAIGSASQLLHHHYRSWGHTAELRALSTRLDRYEQSVAAAHAERTWVSWKDRFEPHTLSLDTVAGITDRLRGEAAIRGAWLARKRLEHPSRQPVFVLVVDVETPWHGWGRRDRESSVIERLRLQLEVPGRVAILGRAGRTRRVWNRVRAVQGSQVLVR